MKFFKCETCGAPIFLENGVQKSGCIHHPLADKKDFHPFFRSETYEQVEKRYRNQAGKRIETLGMRRSDRLAKRAHIRRRKERIQKRKVDNV